MKLPWKHPPPESTEVEERHIRVMADLKAKDHEIDRLLDTAQSLVGELRQSVTDATGRLRQASMEGPGDDGC